MDINYDEQSPKFPIQALITSIIASIILSLIFSWFLNRFGGNRPWLSLIFFIIIVFVLFWLFRLMFYNINKRKQNQLETEVTNPTIIQLG